MPEIGRDYLAGYGDATAGLELGRNGCFGGHSRERKAEYKRGFNYEREVMSAPRIN